MHLRGYHDMTVFRTREHEIQSLNIISFPYKDANPDQYASTMSGLWTLVTKDESKSTPIGFLPESVLQALVDTPEDIAGPLIINRDRRTVRWNDTGDYEEMVARAATLTNYWRKNKTFRVLAGWRDELYPVWGPDGVLLYTIERSAAALFGVVTYGVHMTAYVKSPTSSHGIKIWIPRRSRTKQTFPGMLDNTVAGGKSTFELEIDCLARECEEEASLDPEYVRSHAQAFPPTTYIYVRDEESTGEVGLVQPEVEYIFDLELPENMVPKPNDSEVEQFCLWTVEEVQEHMAKGEFKPNCAVVMLDFFIRRGIIMKESEPNYEEIKRRVHRHIEFPGPHHPKE